VLSSAAVLPEERHVSACRGWAGEKAVFLNSLQGSILLLNAASFAHTYVNHVHPYTLAVLDDNDRRGRDGGRELSRCLTS
jgi:hypothetical protein